MKNVKTIAMKKILSILLSFCIMLSPIIFSGCKISINQNRDKKVVINNINYSSLSEAVQNAKEGDKIEIYNDISDNKNVIIDKSLSIIGKINQSKIKPKFYGSITIDTSKFDSSITIENVEIINPGKYNANIINNTLYAINLIDGGLSLKNCKVMPDSNVNDTACGLVISRKYDSINNMPITISGNQFGCYEYKENLNSAILIKSNKDGEYKNLPVNTYEIQSKNNFDDSSTCNQIVFADYSETKSKYTFIKTSSADFMIDCLKNNHQSNNYNNYTLSNAENISDYIEEPIYILSNTSLSITGTKTLDLKNTNFKIAGTIYIDTSVENATFERISGTACILFSENIDQSKLTIV